MQRLGVMASFFAVHTYYWATGTSVSSSAPAGPIGSTRSLRPSAGTSTLRSTPTAR